MLAKLSDLEDEQIVGSLLSHGETDSIAGMKRRLVEQFPRLGNEDHRPHFRHQPGHSLVSDQYHGLAASALEHARDAVETLGGKRFTVGAPDAGGEPSEENHEQRRNSPAR